MFDRITAVDEVYLVPEYRQKLHEIAREVVFYSDRPSDDEELVRRIGSSDAVLVSFHTRIGEAVLSRCPNLKYVGMCCSLYSEESANVDIPAARRLGITVTGIRDYGDRGVAEFVINQLTGVLHGFGCKPIHGRPSEIYGLKAGMVGFGTSGRLVANTLRFFGAEVSYFCRTPKKEAEGMEFKPLERILKESDAVFCCLNKNVILLHEEEFKALGNGKMLFNTSIGPAFDESALEHWLDNPENHFFSDSEGAAGNVSKGFFERPNVHCTHATSGMTVQAYTLLSEKVFANVKSFLDDLA